MNTFRSSFEAWNLEDRQVTSILARPSYTELGNEDGSQVSGGRRAVC
jgi:hypothetical protein